MQQAAWRTSTAREGEYYVRQFDAISVPQAETEIDIMQQAQKKRHVIQKQHKWNGKQ